MTVPGDHGAPYDAWVEAEERAGIENEGPLNGTSVSAIPLFQRLTDLGNAKRFVLQHAANLRYVTGWDQFLVFVGSHWQRDDTKQAVRWAKQTVQSIWTEAGLGGSKDERKQIADHALRSENAARIDAILKLASSEEELVVRATDLDADPFLLNVANGTIDLRTGSLRPHRREDLLTKLAPTQYDPEAEAPRWRQFLDLIFAGNANLIAYVQRAVGYSCTGDVSEQCLFFAHGRGANGKSTLLSALNDVLGSYAKTADPELLMVRRGEAHPTSIADLCGARFVTSIEVEQGRRFAEVMVKWLTGGDRLKARQLYRDFFEFQPTHKFWLAANHRPIVRGTDHAIWRRIHLIPFDVCISDVTTRDPHFGHKLKQEYPGILRWVVAGCLDWQRNGLNPPAEVKAATNDYRDEMDELREFLDECCAERVDAKVTAKELYTKFRTWAEDRGERPMTQTCFGTRLGERGFRKSRGGSAGGTVWHGLELNANVSPRRN